MDADEEKRKLLEKFREDIHKRSLSNTENYDRSILTLSASFLGFSLAFIKDLAVTSNTFSKVLLVMSWSCFFVAIALTLISFHASERALSVALRNAESYYLRDDQNAIAEANKYEKWNSRFNIWSGFAFALGSLLTVIFVALQVLKI